MPKDVLVTGANGYTGANLCRYLADRGVAVRAMYYRPDGEPDFEHELIEWVAGDLRERDSLERAVDGIDTLYNIAALYRVGQLEEERIRNDVELTEAEKIEYLRAAQAAHRQTAQDPAIRR